MIEHDMDTALDLAETVILLHYGKVIVEGPRDAVVADPADARGVSWPLTRSPSRTFTRYYGDSHVLHGVSFSLKAGRRAGPARTQRRGQDHLHQHGRRSC